MLGYHGMSEHPISTLVSTRPELPTDRILITNNFTAIVDRIDRYLVLGNGIFSASFSAQSAMQGSASGGSHSASRSYTTAISLAALAGASFAAGTFSVQASVIIAATGGSYVSGGFNSISDSTLSIIGSSV